MARATEVSDERRRVIEARHLRIELAEAEAALDLEHVVSRETGRPVRAHLYRHRDEIRARLKALVDQGTT